MTARMSDEEFEVLTAGLPFGPDRLIAEARRSRVREAQLEAEHNEAQAQCAAMREALMDAEPSGHEALKAWLERRRKAFASDAGRAMLKRLRIAENPRVTIESAFAQTEQALKVADMVQKTSDERVARAIAEERERCAKLFEGPGSHVSSWHAPDIAARIRALGEGT